ncbi:MAG: dihydroorotate dehydrogenase [Magnetococcales bacterium]|nr:dihydroorotate dehydrogenase [Magnetococcales bacterium]MBF0155557.1 dihydroorotate dehydrogenase [Magnetococcales bacterium]
MGSDGSAVSTAAAAHPAVDLAVDLAGVRLATPVVLLSGCVGFGRELGGIAGFDYAELGAIFLKGTTLNPRKGNPTPRLAETPGGLLNAIGLQNPGAREVVARYLPPLASLPTRFFANIAGSTVAEYAEVAAIFDDSPVAGIEINISCPNVKAGGAAFGADPRLAFEVVEAVRRATTKPLITKLSPNVTDIRPIARAAIEAGSDALAAINTLMGMAVDHRKGEAILGNVQGGLSGAAIKPVALLQVWRVREVAAPLGIPVIGQGGIATATDAMEFLLVGATAVGVGTALFRDPLAGNRIARELVPLIAARGASSPGEVTGALRLVDR